MNVFQKGLPPQGVPKTSSFFKSAGTFRVDGAMAPLPVPVEDLAKPVVARIKAKALDKSCSMLGISMTNTVCGAVSKVLRTMRSAATTTSEQISHTGYTKGPPLFITVTLGERHTPSLSVQDRVRVRVL